MRGLRQFFGNLLDDLDRQGLDETILSTVGDEMVFVEKHVVLLRGSFRLDSLQQLDLLRGR